MEEPEVHFGMDCAQLKTLDKYRDATNLGIAQLFATNMIQNWEIKRGDKNYKVLETAPRFFELSHEETKEYARFLLDATRDS